MLRSKLSSLREYLTPINHNSNFSKTGEISPEEFVKAGDYLVYKFPTWQWSSCPKSLQKNFLPPEKQYLITKHVPSYQRASDYLGNRSTLDEDEEELEDGWVKSYKLEKPERVGGSKTQPEEINDIDDLIDENAEDDNDELDDEYNDLELINNSNNKLRKYDLYITYSTSYRVPKLYLVGFNSNGIPLLPEQMFEDIQSDYKDKTATIENLPVSFNTTSVSIHPCRHSSVMKTLMKYSKNKKKTDEISDDLDNLNINENNNNDNNSNDDDGIRVDQYLIIFLKFIASVTPGIEYDYTMDAL